MTQLTTCENTVFTDNIPLPKTSYDIQFGIRFDNVVFRDMVMRHVRFYSCEFINCIFINCIFIKDSFQFGDCDFNHVIFRNCDLEGQDFNHLKLETTYFEGTSLENISLWRVRGNGAQIKTMLSDKYAITYTADSLQIGCKNYLIKEWRSFTNRDIVKMNGKEALEWWKENKERIFKTIANDPAEPTTTQR